MKKQNKQKGFTLVELVIVIAVIAILAGVLIPTFSGIVEKANKSAALQNCTTAYQEVTLELVNSDIDLNGKVLEYNGFYFEIKDGTLVSVDKDINGLKYAELTNNVKLWNASTDESGAIGLKKGNSEYSGCSWTGDHNCALITFALDKDKEWSLVVYDENGNEYYSESDTAGNEEIKNGCYFCMWNYPQVKDDANHTNWKGTPSTALLNNTKEEDAVGWYTYKLTTSNGTTYGIFYYSAK